MAEKREPLGPQKFIEAATELVDKNGLAALSMRALGAHMGVDATAIYRHFPNKDSLVWAMIDALLGEVVAEPDDPTLPPRERIIRLASAMRDAFRSHTDLGLALVESEGMSLNGIEVSRRAISSLRDMGLKSLDLVRMYQAFEGFVMGACVMDFSGSPHNYEIRRARYRFVNIPELDEAARSTELVEELADLGFMESLIAIIDRAEYLVKHPTK
jgi:AcrR family transcriptional regulator